MPYFLLLQRHALIIDLTKRIAFNRTIALGTGKVKALLDDVPNHQGVFSDEVVAANASLVTGRAREVDRVDKVTSVRKGAKRL